MDRLGGLAKYYNQAKNTVLNVSEIEAKVSEATSDKPWGASATLKQEIAQGTFDLQQRKEIVACINSRFTESEGYQWRQIYKALQLLEHIIKHGSENVVDDMRPYMPNIKLLGHFHYIDERGQDQGINVRNRAKGLVELLQDSDRIRQEREAAKPDNRSVTTSTNRDGSYEGENSNDRNQGGSSTTAVDEAELLGFQEINGDTIPATTAAVPGHGRRGRA